MSDPENDEQFEGDEEGDEEQDNEGGEEEQEEAEESNASSSFYDTYGRRDFKDPDMILSEEMVADCLSLLCKTGDGMSHAYVRLDVHEKELTDISMLNSYIHLRYVDLSKNNLRSISSLNSLTHLLTLKCDNNKLTSGALEQLPYLQMASFAYNRIKTTEGFNHPLLEHLNLNHNHIPMVRELDPSKLSRLHTLELRGNRLTTTAGFNLPCLKNLFLAANKITKVEDLDNLPHLATLHMRDNQIENLDGFTENLKQLQYINLKGNSVSDLKEIKKLESLPLLRAVVLGENPIAEEDEYRLEVIIALRRLERLDKDEYTDEERQEAQEQYEIRRQEALQAEDEDILRDTPQQTPNQEDIIDDQEEVIAD